MNTSNDRGKGLSPVELNRILADHERYVLGRGGARASFRQAVLDRAVLANRKLDEADFTGASLVGAKFYGSSLVRTSLYCADLRDCDLRNTKLIHADMRGACFRGADLAHAVLDFADLRNGKMMVMNEDGVAMVDRVKGAGAFGGVDFTNCSLRNASFGQAKLDGANFSGALLLGTTFRGAQLTNATFVGAVFMGVNMAEINVPKETFIDCVFDVTPAAVAKAQALKDMLARHQEWVASDGKAGAVAVLDGEDLRPIAGHLRGRSLVGLSARGAIAIGADFSGSALQGAKFDGADLRCANFDNADLSGTSFHFAKLIHARFVQARLGILHLHNGDELAPNLIGADALPEQFARAVLEEPLAAMGLAEHEDVKL